MRPVRILIVEDEVLIADTIARYLERQGYQIVGSAISYEEARELFLHHRPDLVLIDIRLSGPRSGIDLAHFIRRQPQPIPFLYLTSQVDSHNLEQAKETQPAGYLTKPIQKQTLYSTIEVVMHNVRIQDNQEEHIELYDGKQHHKIKVDAILFLRADHNYIQVELLDKRPILQRSTLQELLEQLPAGRFVRTHRSYAVNVKHIQSWRKDCLFVKDHPIPVSRSRRREVLTRLKRR